MCICMCAHEVLLSYSVREDETDAKNGRQTEGGTGAMLIGR